MPVVQEPLGWERLGMTYSHRISESTLHGGRQRREILGTRSSVWQRSARSSPPRRRRELNPLLNFQPPVHFTAWAPRGSIKPPGPSFWPQVVFCNKNAQNPTFLLENSLKKSLSRRHRHREFPENFYFYSIFTAQTAQKVKRGQPVNSHCVFVSKHHLKPAAQDNKLT